MTRWQYGRLTVVYEGKQVVETRGGIFSTPKQESSRAWKWQWFGPDGGTGPKDEKDDRFYPIALLNQLGKNGWEVIHFSRNAHTYEYLLKRPVA